MKKFSLFFIFLIFLLLINAISLTAQLSKFEKWQQLAFFKGFTMSIWVSPEGRYVNQSDFDALKAINANLVVIETKGSMSVEPPYGPSINYQEGDFIIYEMDLLDSMVSFTRNSGLMYVIAVRTGPGRVDVSEQGESTVWTNPAEQQLYGRMLKEMAARYLPDTLFVGMVMTVEPNPLGEMWEPPITELADSLLTKNININVLQTLWIDSIRTFDKDLPLIVGGVHASHPEYFSLMDKQSDDKIVYTTHLYNPANYSHAAEPYSMNYPGEYWCVRLGALRNFDKSFLVDELYKPVLDFQKLYNVPIFIGEFGIRAPQNGGEQYLSDIASNACKVGWHFAIWGFNNGPEFNYRNLDSIYGTNYWQLVKSFMDCGSLSVESKEDMEQSNAVPNPFWESTVISWQSSVSGRVKIDIFNSLGEKITTLADEWQEAGRHSATFSVRTNGRSPLQSSMYYYRIQIRERIESGKLLLIR